MKAYQARFIFILFSIITGITLFPVEKAFATSIAIVNPSFEADIQGYGGYSYLFISGWGGNGTNGTWYPSTTYYPSGVPDGVNIAYNNFGTLSQTLTTLLADSTTYTLGVWIGLRGDYAAWGSHNYVIELLAGSTVIATAANPVIPGVGQFGLATLTYTSALIDPYAGQALGIALINYGPQMNYDNVTLNASPSNASPSVPEPATLVLVGLGFAALGLASCRKTIS